MSACKVHCDSWGDKLARGMSWPIRASDFVAALSERIEPEIWLSLYRRDKAKEWAQSGIKRTPIELLRCQYDTSSVLRQVDRARADSKYSSLSVFIKPWYGLDDPPLLDAYVYSLPAIVLKESGATRQVIATEVQRAVRQLAPPAHQPITARDWRISLRLDTDTKSLVTRHEVRPTQKWSVVAEIATAIT